MFTVLIGVALPYAMGVGLEASYNLDVWNPGTRAGCLAASSVLVFLGAYLDKKFDELVWRWRAARTHKR